MRIYVTYFGYYLWLAFLYYLSVRDPRRVTVKERINHKTVTRYNWLFALAAIAPLVYLAAKRSMYFADTYNYWIGFQNAPSSFSRIPAYLQGIKKDKAFYFFAAFWRCILGNHPSVYLGIVALFQATSITKTFRKYSPYLITALFIFFSSTDYYSYMQNGIRQFVAVAIIFGMSEFIFEKNYILALITILIASRFHGTALLMIPVIFIVQGEPWNKRTVFMLVLSFLAIIYVNQFTNILNNMLEETQYTNVVSDWTAWHDDGTNPLRVAVYCVPAILSLIGINYIREENDPVINICTNMSVVSAGLYLISMVTSGIFMGRLPIYVSMYSNCILLPWEIDHIFNKNSAQIIRVLMIVAYLIFYYYQIHRTWGMI